MPITDPEKKRIAQQSRLVMKICFKCGARNDIAATRCRKCRNPYLRLKNRTLQAAQVGSGDGANGSRTTVRTEHGQRMAGIMSPAQTVGRTSVSGFEGSPLDPRYTFESFVIGSSNRMAHAGATQVAETALADKSGFNPLYIHSSVGLGKTHLLHAIAWEIKRREPHAQVLYLTAERFRYQFVEALRSQDPLAFKDKFRCINILLIDDPEFMHGERTE